MSTRLILTPYAAEFPSSNFPQLSHIHSTARRPVLSFDASTEQACYWSAMAPQSIGSMTVVVTYVSAATSGGVVFGVSVEAITDGDTTDTDAAESFDTENTGSATVPSTAGQIDQVSITLTNADSIAAADYVRFKLARKTGNASDTAAGLVHVLAVEVRDDA